jgi:hypothetical protein
MNPSYKLTHARRKLLLAEETKRLEDLKIDKKSIEIIAMNCMKIRAKLEYVIAACDFNCKSLYGNLSNRSLKKMVIQKANIEFGRDDVYKFDDDEIPYSENPDKMRARVLARIEMTKSVYNALPSFTGDNVQINDARETNIFKCDECDFCFIKRHDYKCNSMILSHSNACPSITRMNTLKNKIKQTICIAITRVLFSTIHIDNSYVFVPGINTLVLDFLL